MSSVQINKFDSLKDISSRGNSLDSSAVDSAYLGTTSEQSPQASLRTKSDARDVPGTSYLREGCTLRGAFECEGSFELSGFVEGDIVVRGKMILGETAVARANIRAVSLTVFGKLQGDVICEDLVELQGGAQVKGNIRARRIVIQDGVVFDGSCKMPVEDKKDLDAD